MADDAAGSLMLTDHRAIGEIRVVLAIAILVAAAFVPRPNHEGLAVYAVIGSYIAFALALYAIALMRPRMVRLELVHWLDAGWLLLIVGLWKTNSPVFLLLLFPVLVASAQAGFLRGMAVAVVSVLVTFVGHALFGRGPVVTPETALQAGVLLSLGFMLARWAGGEVQFKHKLDALHRLGKQRGLRDDVDAFWADTLEILATYSGAKTAFFVGHGTDGKCRIHEHEVGKPAWSMALDEKTSAALTILPETWAVSWRAVFFNPRRGRSQIVDVLAGTSLKDCESRPYVLAQTLDSARWLSFPLHTALRYRGRVFLLDIEGSKIGLDWEFVRQLARHVGLRLDNLLLAGELRHVIASGERERISRDLHDGTVQPYLGLRYGLEALRRKIADENSLAGEVDELITMTDDSISRLRGYIHDLRQAESNHAHPVMTALRAQVHQFEEYSGLTVDASIQEFELDEPRMLEVRHIIAEGLSNIRRHTLAKRAALEIVAEQGVLRIAFVNPVTRAAPSFKPRSLSERAAAMGGSVDVMRLATQTIVRIVLPLWTKGEP